MPLQAGMRHVLPKAPWMRIPPRRRLAAPAAAVVTALLAVGCGSTLPLSTQRQMEGGGLAGAAGGAGANSTGSATASGQGGSGSSSVASGAGGPTTAGGSGTASTGNGTGSGSNGSSSGSAGGSSARGTPTGTGAGGAAGGGSTGAGGGSTLDGPGVTASTIYVAGLYSSQSAAADSAIGAANANPGNIQAETDAVVKYINAHGGVDHRRLQTVWYDESLSNDASTTYQGACSTWTQDNKSFVMIAGAPILDQCTADEHAVAVYVGQITSETTAALDQYPADINLDGPTNDHAMTYTIQGLARQGYFASGAKVGIATWDDPNFHYGIDHAAVPALAALGIHNIPVAYITSPQNYNDLGSTSAAVSSAVLKFHQQGIDHVILFDGESGVTSSGILVLEWMQQANSQEYYPKYGLNSTSGFNALVGDLPKQEEVGSVGVSWEPPLDETGAAFAAAPLPPDGKLCQQIMATAGQPAANNNALIIQLGICDQLFFIQRSFDTVQGPLNQSSALRAIDAVGTRWTDLTTFGVELTANRHDGVAEVRNMAFDTSCTCYNYIGGPYYPGS
jgi:hypothetical protein